MITGESKPYNQKWNFIVSIDDMEVAGFTQCSELKLEIGTVLNPEGGRMVDRKEPGKVKYNDVTLSLGATDDRQLWDWCVRVANGVTGTGVDPTDKKNMAIIQRRRDGTEIKRWNIFKAFPNAFVAGEWDATAEESVIEQVTFAYEYFDLGQGT